MNKRCVVSVVAFSFFVSACRQVVVPSADYMILDEIAYVDTFPHTFTIGQGTLFDPDVIGVSSIVIRDSLLLISTSDNKGYWSLVSLPEYKHLGKYLMKGNGPNELLSSPWVKQQNFLKEQGRLKAIIYSFPTGKSYKMDLSETIKNKALRMRMMQDSFPRNLTAFIVLDSTTFLCKEINEEHTRQIRYILHKGEKTIPENLEKLNFSSVRAGEDFNILSTATKCNADGSRIVEAPNRLNQINVYSPDGSFGKTICVGRQLDRIGDVQDLDPQSRKRTYMDLVAFPDFFGALYLGEKRENIGKEMSKKPVIQFFDWDGNPLAEVKLDRFVSAYAVDLINGDLYALNYNMEEMYKYDFKEILEKLNKRSD